MCVRVGVRVYVCVCFVKQGHPRHYWPDENVLEIKNVTRKDAGVYTVECSNEEGDGQVSITLDVQCKFLRAENQ